jgi:hypothetical protein
MPDTLLPGDLFKLEDPTFFWDLKTGRLPEKSIIEEMTKNTKLMFLYAKNFNVSRRDAPTTLCYFFYKGNIFYTYYHNIIICT